MNYLYNGIELPPLPEWDKETYPNAYIARNTDADSYEYGLVLSKKNIGVHSGGLYHFATSMLYKCIDGDWTLETSALWGLSGVVVWSNTDVYYDTYDSLGDLAGTLYLAASTPIPVYDPTVLLQGYLVGCRIRAMRGKKKWEVLYEGEVSTDVLANGKGFWIYLHDYQDGVTHFQDGDNLRLTVDGTAHSYTAFASANQVYAGNKWLFLTKSASDDSDDGTDYALRDISGALIFAARNSGTYHLKVERMVT